MPNDALPLGLGLLVGAVLVLAVIAAVLLGAPAARLLDAAPVVPTVVPEKSASLSNKPPPAVPASEGLNWLP